MDALHLVEAVAAVGVTAVVRGGSGLVDLVVDGGVGLDGRVDGLVDDVGVVVLGSGLGHESGGLGLLGGRSGLVVRGRGGLGSRSRVGGSLLLLLVRVGRGSGGRGAGSGRRGLVVLGVRAGGAGTGAG